MTVSTVGNRVSAAGNGVTTAFSFPNRFFADTDLVVAVVTDATGVAATKTLTTHYTVSGAGDAGGGTVTMLTAPATGETLVIYRDPPMTQLTDMVDGDPFSVETGVEAPLDRQMLVSQRLRDLIDRSMRLNDADTSGADPVLPIPVANTILGWDGTATSIVNKVAADLSLTTVTAFASTVLDDATATAMLDTLRAALAAETTPASDDEVIVKDASAAANVAMTLRNLFKTITVLATETAPDMLDELALYDVSGATADKITLANLLKVINSLTEDTTPDRAADYFLSYDASATAAKKVKLDTIVRYEDVRQTVVAGSVDSNGQANFLNAGTGLAVDMDATTTPVVATFAAGEDAVGPINYRTRFTADQAEYFTSLAASNTSYLLLDRDTATGAISAYKTLIPPQYSAAFDKTRQSLLNFEGSDASTTITDDYGNTWAAGGNAQLDTAQFKFGTSSLLLDGTGDYIGNTSVNLLGSDSWQVEGWVRFNALPGAGASTALFNAANAGAYGVLLNLNNTVGTYYHQPYLSSDGASWNIVNGTGVAIAAPATGVWYHWSIGYDAVAGRYYSYWDGTKVLDITSANKVCAVTATRFGLTTGGANGLNGWLDDVRFSPCCRYPAGATFTPPTAAHTADAEWFDSATATWKYGSPTSWTTKQRVCVGEVTTNATVPTSITAYALRGAYTSPRTAIPASGTLQSFSHNVGRPDTDITVSVVCVTGNKAYQPGDRIVLSNSADAAAGGVSFGHTGRNTAGVTFSSGIPAIDKGAATVSSLTVAFWNYELKAKAKI
jgi:hypothetical protein